MGFSEFTLLPSVIGCDLCNLQKAIEELKEAGYQNLHVDVLDGHYSPSMPIGLDTYKQLAKRTDLGFDIHIMSTANEFFVSECIKMNPRRICFQVEGERHITNLIGMVKNAGIQVGLAFSPATNPATVQHILPECDFVLLMRIEPGYAGFSNRELIGMMDKIRQTRQLLDSIRPGINLTIDGRVSFDDAPALMAAGVDSLVCGSKSAFAAGGTPKENYEKMCSRLREAGMI